MARRWWESVHLSYSDLWQSRQSRQSRLPTKLAGNVETPSSGTGGFQLSGINRTIARVARIPVTFQGVLGSLFKFL